MAWLRVAVACLALAAGVSAAAPTPDCTTVSCKNGSITLDVDSYVTDEQLKNCELAVYNKDNNMVSTVAKTRPLRVKTESCLSEFYFKIMTCPYKAGDTVFCFTVESSTPKNELRSSASDRSRSFVSIPLAVFVVVVMVLAGYAVKKWHTIRKLQFVNGSQAVSIGGDQG